MQVDEAQRESEQAYEAARDAQRRANQAAADADRATRDAQQKQAEAQRAEQHATQLQAEAQNAQQQAIITSREATKRAEAAQQRALVHEPRAEAQVKQEGPTTSLSGTLESVSNDELVVSRPGTTPMHVGVDPQQTTALQSGQKVEPTQLQQGAPVTVQYRVENGRPIAEIVAQDTSTTQPEQP